MNLLKYTKRASTIAIAVVVLLMIAHSETTNAKTTKEIIQESISELIAIKDDTTLDAQTKKIQELEIAKATLEKIVTVGREEVKSFQRKLKGLAIENLVTDDYTFDAGTITETLGGLLSYYDAYYAESTKHIRDATTQEDMQRIAGDLESWRSAIYNPGIQIILSIDLVLKQKNILKISNNRFEKILNDLRRLKNNKLITSIVSLDPLLRQATADQKIANALGQDGATFLLHTLQNLGSDDRNTIATTNYKKIKNVVEQSFMKIRDMYKQFMEINKKVQVMLQGGV